MSFFGNAFVHGIVRGIALAVELRFSPSLGAAAAAVVTAAVRRHARPRCRDDLAKWLLHREPDVDPVE
jgi:ABC-type Mn2+/Zn2+ transport system permease subunit